MTPEGVERKLAAILSADVVGYSRLMAEDEAGTVRRLTEYREQIAMLVRQHRGRVVDSPGDNVLAEFPTATDAVSCAVEVQGVLNARNAPLPEDQKMEFRVGVHLGEVRVEGERIYGDGVNIASRLEGLAQPGGICVSSTVHEQIEKKLNVALEDLGEQTLKNIPKPIHVYGVKLLLPEAKRESAEKPRAGADDLTVPGFGGRPAIAVLPFDNLSGDHEQEYFADGISEDLITRLSAFRNFPVIARNSSFTYKGKSVDVKQVSQELGARYVVEGSVRKAGDRVRISAQLIDATTGHHVWAERYDRELEDIFALQDKITEAIVAAMSPELLRFEQERAARREPRNLDAYDCLLRGMWFSYRNTSEGNKTSREFYEQAAHLDPQLADAFAGIAFTHLFDVSRHWTDSPPRSIAELHRNAKAAVALDPQSSIALTALGWAYGQAGQEAEMFTSLRRAIELDPSSAQAHAHLGTALVLTGRADDGLVSLETALRLDPKSWNLWYWLGGISWAHFAAGRYEEALDWARRSIEASPDQPWAYRVRAAACAHLGRLDEARGALQEWLRLEPGISVSGIKLEFWTAFADADFLDRYLDGLRKAGLKE